MEIGADEERRQLADPVTQPPVPTRRTTTPTAVDAATRVPPAGTDRTAPAFAPPANKCAGPETPPFARTPRPTTPIAAGAGGGATPRPPASGRKVFPGRPCPRGGFCGGLSFVVLLLPAAAPAGGGGTLSISSTPAATAN